LIQDSLPPPALRFEPIERARRQNLRQLLLRSARIVNRDVVAGLQARGYHDLRSTHTTLLSNIDLAGSSVTEAADRAGISKQAMGRLAADLVDAGYIRLDRDPSDARVRVIRLTPRGERLMLDSLEVMAGLQDCYAAGLGKARFAALLMALSDFVDHGTKARQGTE
jgi:DNA-binding MarR family transcriptional regulator